VFPPFTFDNAHNSCVRWQLGSVSARTDAGAQLSVEIVDTLAGNDISVNYTGNVVEVTVTVGCLRGGETVRVTIGDQFDGGEPAIAQWLSGPDMPFHVAIDVNGGGSFVPLTRFPRIEVLGNRPERLVCVAPSTSKVGEPFALRIKAEDGHTNISSLYQSPLRIDPGSGATGPTETAIALHDRGQKQIDGLQLTERGTHRIRVGDDRFGTLSSPVSTEFTEPGESIYWGEIHAHCELGDGIGSENRYYEYARDEAWLDFAAIGEHRGGGEWWPCCVEAARRYDEPGRFVTLLGYEGSWVKGAHANVYGIDLDLPLHDRDHADEIFALVSEGKALFVPHHTNDPLVKEAALFRWDEFDPDTVHVAEICQMRGSFEKDELGGHVLFAGFGCSLQDGLRKGFRFGFTGGTDNHCGRAGSPMYSAFHSGHRVGSGNTCDIDRMYLERTQCGLTAVFAPELTRDAVFSALRERRTYATTGARILLNFEANGLRMGEEGSLSAPVTINVRVAGTAPLESITIVRSNEDVHVVPGAGLDQELTWQDSAPEPGSWYYVRVVQEDGHLAWASPIWFD